MASVTRSVVAGLKTYLDTYMESLQSVYADFPNPGQKLKFPSASIFTGKPRFIPLQHHTHSIGELDPVTNKALVLKKVGSWNFDLQVDVWVDNKFDRHDLQEEFFAAFNSDIRGNGMNLQLPSYYNMWCHYSIDGFEYLDDEMGSQTNQWRVQFRVLADVGAILERLEHLVENVENNTEVLEEELQATEDTSYLTSFL